MGFNANYQRPGSPSSINQEYLYISTVVAMYWIISSCSSYINKNVLSQAEDFDGPLFVIWFQCICAFIVCALMSKCRGILKMVTGLELPEIKLSLSFQLILRALPLSFVFVAMVSLDLLCIKYVGVAFYYLVRSFTTLMNVTFSFSFLNTRVSNSTMTCCIVITIGCLMGLDEEALSGGLTLYGAFSSVLATCFVALYPIYVKKTLPHFEDSVWSTTLYSSFNIIILFLPILYLFHELPDVIFVTQIQEFRFWALMIAGGILGLCTILIVNLQVKATSALTHNISDTARAWMHMLVLTLLHGSLRPTMWWLSVGVVFLGCLSYAKVQQSNMKRDNERFGYYSTISNKADVAE